MSSTNPPRHVDLLARMTAVSVVLALLVGAVLFFNDRLQRQAVARDTVRHDDVSVILNAILNEQVDTGKPFMGGPKAPFIDDAAYAQVIVTDTTGIDCRQADTRPACGTTLQPSSGHALDCVVDLSPLVPSRINALPTGPRGSGYFMRRGADGTLEIGACKAEAEPEISLTH